MTTFGQAVHEDVNGIKTSARYGALGDSTDDWFQRVRLADGGDVAQGLKADAAVTDPTASGTLIALIKGLLTRLSVGANSLTKAEDAVAASGDAGVMALAVRRDTPTSDAAAGDYHALHVDSLGRLRIVDDSPQPSNATSTALATNLVVKASAGTLYEVRGYSTVTQFLQIHNTTSLPADTAVPAVVIPITAGAHFAVSFGRRGRSFSTGITICNSSTGPTKTIGAADTWVDAQYV